MKMKNLFLSIGWIFLLQFELVQNVPIKTPDDNIPPVPTADSCNLPSYLDFSSEATFLEDCKGLDRANIPVPHSAYGNIPRVCCPPYRSNDAICFPSDYGCPGYKPVDFGDSYDYSYDQEGSEVIDYDDSPVTGGEDYTPNFGSPFDDDDDGTLVSEMFQKCEVKSQTCTTISRCQNIQFPNETEFCGMENNEMKVCCPPENVVDTPPPMELTPRFPKSGEARGCDDKVVWCRKWSANGACDLDKEHITGEDQFDPVVSSFTMFKFMLLSCQRSCNWCGNKGCVDEHAMCKTWSQAGFCVMNPTFMSYVCRESCGTCGFLSPESKEEQVVNENSYSDLSGSSFDCGRYKDLDELKAAGLNVFQDTFPDRNKCTPEELKQRGGDGEASATDYDTRTTDDYEFEYDDNDDISDTSFANTVNLESGNITCGQILITDKWMLSAAHCYDKFEYSDNIRVSTIRTYLPDFQETVLQRKVFLHPDYRTPKLYADIALIQLGTRIIFDYEGLGDTPTCLSKDEQIEGKVASITGYGETEEGEDAGERLGTVNTTLIGHQNCNELLTNYVSDGKPKKLKNFCRALESGILEEHICGRGQPLCTDGEKIFSGACKGDSGGPVETTINDRRTLVALVSGSLNCNSPLPEWFTKISYFSEWIACIIREADGNQKSKEDIDSTCSQFITQRNSKPLDVCSQFEDL